MSVSIADVSKLVPLARNRQLSSFSQFSDIDNWFQYHSGVVTENWYFYLGFHNLFLQRFEQEDDRDFLQRVQSATIENHVRPIINLMVAHLYGSKDSIKRYVTRDEEPDDTINKILKQNVWFHNNQDELNDTKALNALVSGYTAIQRQWTDLRTNKPFPLGANPKDITKYGIIKKIPLDSEYCVPLPYTDSYGAINPRRLGAILFIADYDNYIGNKTVMSLLGRPRMELEVIEYVDDEIWVKWQRKKGENAWTQIPVNPGSSFENKNPYGDVNIPFTLYRNTGDPFYLEGDSEVPPLKSLNIELNELANGDKDTIRYHQYPILQGLDGATIPVGFKRTKNAVIELDRKGAKFEYLTWEGKLEASSGRQEEIRRVLSQVSGLSLISRGFLKEIGQIRSGPPLKALFTSDRAVMSRKFTQFRTCEIEDMRADLKFYEFHSGTKAEVDKTVQFHADFQDDFLGIDRLLEEEIKSLQIQSGTVSVEEILQQEHPDWSTEEIKKEAKRISDAKMAPVKAKLAKQQSQSPDKKALQQDRTPQ